MIDTGVAIEHVAGRDEPQGGVDEPDIAQKVRGCGGTVADLQPEMRLGGGRHPHDGSAIGQRHPLVHRAQEGAEVQLPGRLPPQAAERRIRAVQAARERAEEAAAATAQHAVRSHHQLAPLAAAAQHSQAEQSGLAVPEAEGRGFDATPGASLGAEDALVVPDPVEPLLQPLSHGGR